MEGYIQLHRCLIESNCFCNPVTLKIWIWLLLKAKWKEGHFSLKVGRGSTDVFLKRGQLLFGRFAASEELGIPGTTIYEHLQKLEKNGNISLQSDKQYTIITICKYDSYNSIDNEVRQPTDNQPSTNRQPTVHLPSDNRQTTDTYNKDNKDNKDNKENNVKNKEPDINIPFGDFWKLYEKNVGDKKKIEKKWKALTDKERQKAIDHIPKYKEAQPDKQFRKNPETYLNNKSFNDEIINQNASSNTTSAKTFRFAGNVTGRANQRNAGQLAVLNNLSQELGLE